MESSITVAWKIFQVTFEHILYWKSKEVERKIKSIENITIY